MLIYPAIDLYQGRVVRLTQGRIAALTHYPLSPVEQARQFQSEGAKWIHVVDLDAALNGISKNFDLVRAIIDATGLQVQLGGGISTQGKVSQALSSGVSRIVIGTKACQSPDYITAILRAYGPDRLAVGIDVKNGTVSTNGWTDQSSWTAPSLARNMVELGVKTLIYTDVATDGMLSGPNLQALKELQLIVPTVNLIASGGVATLEHIMELRRLNLAGVIVGKALYEGKLHLSALGC